MTDGRTELNRNVRSPEATLRPAKSILSPAQPDLCNAEPDCSGSKSSDRHPELSLRIGNPDRCINQTAPSRSKVDLWNANENLRRPRTAVSNTSPALRRFEASFSSLLK